MLLPVAGATIVALANMDLILSGDARTGTRLGGEADTEIPSPRFGDAVIMDPLLLLLCKAGSFDGRLLNASAFFCRVGVISDVLARMGINE